MPDEPKHDGRPSLEERSETSEPDGIARGSLFAPEPSSLQSPAITLEPAGPDGNPGYGKRGRERPLGVAWFGVRSFWGHLQHFIASAIATEDIDSRDWMRADAPLELADRVASQLLGERPPESKDRAHPRSLAEALERDVWIDFVADSGDDAEVSAAVGRLFAASYRLPDPDPRGGPEHVIAGRGDVLLHGGDLAYPVATDAEIHDRLVVPFNRALVPARDGKRRVVLGVPGNHDWYDGLDGFGRLMRRRVGDLSRELDVPALEADKKSRLGHAVRFVEKFMVAGQMQRIRALVLDGYVPVQDASYFLLPVAKDLDLWGIDRQLRNVDFRQRRFFDAWRSKHPERRRIVLFPDPVYAHLEPSVTGFWMVDALSLDLDETPHLCLAGDLHHYERRQMGASLHVTAGGGGAFLHGARLQRRERKAPEFEWPGQKATAAMLTFVPLHVMLGRAGFIPHLVLLMLFAPALGLGLWASKSDLGLFVATAVAAVVSAIGCAFIGGIQVNKSRAVAGLSAALGLWIAFVPIVTSELFERFVGLVGVTYGPRVDAVVVLLLAVFSGAFAFGAFLAALSALGLESTQAMTALGHPGFKHFVRMRVRRDGSRVDAWTIGLLDPLAKDAKAVLVDRWSWDARASGVSGAPGERGASGASGESGAPGVSGADDAPGAASEE